MVKIITVVSSITLRVVFAQGGKLGSVSKENEIIEITINAWIEKAKTLPGKLLESSIMLRIEFFMVNYHFLLMWNNVHHNQRKSA